MVRAGWGLPFRNNMKKILFLGAAQFQIPPIEYALSQNYYVITCDNKPENPGHKLANKSYNQSTLNKEAILKIAENEKIDAIISYGSDISMPTVSYVGEKLQLNTPSIDVVETLTNKYKFRSFLNESGIQRLENYLCTPQTDLNKIASVLKKNHSYIVKPVDSSGSKGVAVINDFDSLNKAISQAITYSSSRKVIIEEFISKSGPQICGDGFIANGKIKFLCFGDGWFYDNSTSMAPYGETFPSTQNKYSLNLIKQKIENILNAVGYLNGPFNQDSFIDHKGNPFIIEIGPRCGGNYLPTAIKLATSFDLISTTVEQALGNTSTTFSEKHNIKPTSCYMIHSKNSGKFINVELSNELKKFLVQKILFVQKNQKISPFINGADSIGNLILQFPSTGKMIATMKNIEMHVKVIIDEH